MKVNESTKYAILTVGYIAQNQNKGLVLGPSISKHYSIAQEYLTKLMQDLVKANILRSKRGPGGGFSLAKSLSKITLLDIIEAIEGPMTESISLEEYGQGDKFLSKATKAYDKVIAQARGAFRKIRMSKVV
ncbi:MAG TPA: Rrf2 family transcriptional regulator [Sedimentisphaerales bacterium]|nr:Rrf2 family transcriptional regulator [Sedimentisphaerales bacterium]